ncbi:MAG TPA: histidine kinase dimerization/phospho-acceptor domain-containing protein, partial [Vicinamibacterales bacterium]|nr:histidine kinase dimerization/phospho-acceptor domain-containing protein [Vicinamibacterales bacterium]
MTGRIFRRLPIRHKLVTMIMLTSGIVLLLASAGYLISDYYRTREILREDLTADAQLVLENTRAAIAFLDPEAARDTLATLRPNRHIRLACLYDGEGRLFATFRPRTVTRDCPVSRPPDGHQFAPNRLDVVTSIASEGKPAGALLLRSDLEDMASRLRVQTAMVVFLLLMTLAVGLFLSARLQAIVSQPVVNLARTAAEVSARGDYSLRAQRTTEDELGALVDAFNRMLERIELREAELSRANDELRREIAERRRAEQERAALLVREREANRLKDEFLATLSHELRTPLNAILGWTKLLRANAVPPASLERALEKIERNAQVQTRLVEDLLEVSRIASGKLRLETRTFDLVALANTAVDSIRPAAEARGIAIERRYDPPSIQTVGDPDRLQQVIWNLLSNAVKFTPAGGTVALSVQRAGDVDEIVVTDTGIGIDPAF